jgi:hypothetical protein
MEADVFRNTYFEHNLDSKIRNNILFGNSFVFKNRHYPDLTISKGR